MEDFEDTALLIGTSFKVRVRYAYECCWDDDDAITLSNFPIPRAAIFLPPLPLFVLILLLQGVISLSPSLFSLLLDLSSTLGLLKAAHSNTGRLLITVVFDVLCLSLTELSIISGLIWRLSSKMCEGSNVAA